MNPQTSTHPTMHETPFALQVETRGNAAIVHLSGSCTMNVSKTLTDCLRELGGAGHQLVVVDTSQLDFIESSGLGGIVAGYLRMRMHKGEMRLVNPTADIRKLLEMTRLVQLFGIYPTIDAALKA